MERNAFPHILWEKQTPKNIVLSTDHLALITLGILNKDSNRHCCHFTGLCVDGKEIKLAQMALAAMTLESHLRAW